MIKGAIAVGVALVVVLLAAPSAAQQKTGRVITLNEVTIVGRVQRPIAAVDVARIRPRITLSEISQPFLDRVVEAANREPF